MPAAVLAELKVHLNKSDSRDDAELSGFLAAADAMLVDLVGEIDPVSVVEDYRDAGSVVPLRRHPVLSVQSVTTYPGAVTLPAEDLAAGVEGWYLDRGLLVLPCRFRAVRVSYTAGRTVVSDNIRMAVLELAGHLWQVTQNAQPRPQFGGSEARVLSGFAIPRRVVEMVQSDMYGPVVA